MPVYRETPAGAVYPLTLRLAGRLVVVVGGGQMAVPCVAGLRAAAADVLMVAPQLSTSLADLAARGLISARRRPYEITDLEGAWLVLACSDQAEVNDAVAADAAMMRLWCVRGDECETSPAWVPAAGRARGATVTVTAGSGPLRAAALLGACLAAVEAMPRDEPARDERAGCAQRGSRGHVSIVGGGPGDPGLITVTGLERLRGADLVVTDRLAPLELLASLPPHVQVVDAAKVPAGPAMRQEEINCLLVEQARAGRHVVRLKGGDPFVFGRGREEADACQAAGVPFDVVPGVTSAISVPAGAGIPVTHRGMSQGFTVVTGHAGPGDGGSTVDWAALAASRTTLILLMAVERAADIADALIVAGMAAETPAACVANGWSRQQRVVTAVLADLAPAMKEAGITNPAILVIGETARYASAAQHPVWPDSRNQGHHGDDRI